MCKNIRKDNIRNKYGKKLDSTNWLNDDWKIPDLRVENKIYEYSSKKGGFFITMKYRNNIAKYTLNKRKIDVCI